MTTVPPKYQQILARLRTRIDGGEYKAGDRLPSEMDLVAEFGASRLTVARALKELERDGTVQRRAGSGTYLRERPPEPSGLVFGLLIPDLGRTEIFEPICKGIMDARCGDRHSLLWGQSLEEETASEEQARQLCSTYIAQRVSGVFFAPFEGMETKDDLNRTVTRAFDESGIPIVLLDRCVEPHPRRSRYDLVGIDNRRAGFTATEHLLDRGCRRIAFIGRRWSAATVDARIAGYREALALAGVAADPGLVQRIDGRDADAVRKLIDHSRPDGYLCANDNTAAFLLQTLQSLGIEVPRQAKVAGIDDVRYASLLSVPLTTIHQPCHEIGRAARSMMLERIASPAMPARDLLLDCALVVRQSTAAE